MRLFVATEVPSAVKTVVAGLQNQPVGCHLAAKWVRPELMHLTLAFMGEVANHQLAMVRQGLEQVRFSPVQLRLGKLVAIPNFGHCRVLAVGLESGDEALGLVAGSIRQQLARVGVSFDTKPFRSHLTVARLREPVALSAERLKVCESAAPGLQACSWLADSFCLFESQLSSQGPRYRLLHRYQAV